ncbi:hypothetical protein BCU70_02425 [Vibrio sp. 10N.286.49.C2]|uniref:alpha/beta hydrolase n=1 Tax=unclassified Vibrio TaxID=2614977 RepID=UPI000C8642C7|nr:MULTISPECIES: alpha/beta hydrolase [unclassified Vibrio]PMH38156.1 hypothetical protein BCU70_02425 [Vibrio sp. 10N.286.49.C2]PMH53638.1 hypothetical protein BCU66_12410 [Vibrio sp. 10N.286.49.B1]PMH79045.1 hypothetical protein BCU58_06905 [Vibrio sp. 10N.286.48.B7]
MKITWINQLPTPVTNVNGEIYILKSTPTDYKTLEEAFSRASSDLKSKFNALGENRSYVVDLTITTRNVDDVIKQIDQLDKIYRLNMAGKFGKVALVEGEEFSLTVTAVQEEISNDAVYHGYNRQELYDQYTTFFTAPNAAEIAKNWFDTELEDHAEKHTVTFGGSDYRNSLDLILPKDYDEKMPLLIHIHGGYWQYTDKEIYNKIANSYTKHGIAVANFNYPQAPDFSVQEMIDSCQSGIRYLFNNANKYNFDLEKISITGHSSGGHLCVAMGITNWKDVDSSMPETIFKHVLPFSGAYNFEPYMHITQNYCMGLKTSDLVNVSPVHMKCHKGSTFTLYVGSMESDELQQQTIELKKYLEDNRVGVNMIVSQQTHHFSTVDAMYTEGTDIFNHCLSLID